MRRNGVIVVLIGVLALAALAGFAQEAELDQDLDTYTGAFDFGRYLLQSVVWSGIYLAIYAAALIVTLSYLRLFSGQVDADLLTWVGLTWIGGLAMNAVGYAVAHRALGDVTNWQGHLVAVLVALPLIFGWTLLISTRNFSDLPIGFAWRVALVVALVCAPYFGPTWRMPGLEQRVPAQQVSAVAAEVGWEISWRPVDTGARIG